MTRPAPKTRRGRLTDAIAVRLADEVIPVGAIARALLRDAADIRAVLRRGRSAGALRAMPAADWREDKANQAGPQLPMEAIEAAALRVQLAIDLTRTESLVVAVLYVTGAATTNALQVASGIVSHDSLKVTMFRVRAVLKAERIGVATLHGQGYAMAAPDQERLAAILSGGRRRRQHAEAA